MPLYDDFAAKVALFKCFGDDPQGFDCFERFNLIVGRNNTGKSALLDLVELLAAGSYDVEDLALRHQGRIPQFILSRRLTEDAAREGVSSGISTIGITPGHNDLQVVMRYVGETITWLANANGNERFRSMSNETSATPRIETIRNQEMHAKLGELVTRPMRNPLHGFACRRLRAERRIEPEGMPQGGAIPELRQNGAGATQLIWRVLHDSQLDHTLIESTLRQAVNSIFRGEIEFSRIACRTVLDGNQWEVFLEEESKGPIRLSQSGSGIQTVILVLLNVLVFPNLEPDRYSQTVFAFEELENNLHPSVLRRLYQYLLDASRASSSLMVVTTHSAAAIDMISRQPDCQLIHTTHDGKCGTATQISCSASSRAILDDLDVRASDLLQSNCIVWVEGPTDRIYLNRWIELASGGKLVDGIHYQCVFYGGALLAHLTADNETDDGIDRVEVLRTNRHCCLLVDSDKKTDDAPLRETAGRMVNEVEQARGYAWVTAGRTIENYLTKETIGRVLEEDITKDMSPFSNPGEFIGRKNGSWKPFRGSKKVQFALAAVDVMDAEDLNRLDLRDRINILCAKINQWNGIPVGTETIDVSASSFDTATDGAGKVVGHL